MIAARNASSIEDGIAFLRGWNTFVSKASSSM